MNKILPALTLAAASLFTIRGQDLEAAEPAAKPNPIYSADEQTTQVVPSQRPAVSSRSQAEVLAQRIKPNLLKKPISNWMFRPSYAGQGQETIKPLTQGYPKSQSRVEPATRGNWILGPNGRVYRPGETIYPRSPGYSYYDRSYWHGRLLPGTDPRFDPHRSSSLRLSPQSRQNLFRFSR